MLLRRKEGNSCFHSLLATVAVFSTLLLVVVLIRRNHHQSKTGFEQMDADKFLRLINTSYGGPRILERIKLESGNAVDIIDGIGILPNETSPKAYRAIKLTDYNRTIETVFELSLPADRTLCNTDTSKWAVDKDHLFSFTYYYFAAEALFYPKAMKLSRDNNASVLILGLGGGLINSFLHHNFPKMNITVVELSTMMFYVASKWFDLTLDDHHSVVIRDGVEFVEEQAKEGVTYDAVILDACYSDKEHAQVCPVDAFLEKEVIEAISHVVTDKGILIINSFPIARNLTEEATFLNERFQKFFNHCKTREVGQSNKMFYCMHQAESNEGHIDLQKFLDSNPLTSVQL